MNTRLSLFSFIALISLCVLSGLVQGVTSRRWGVANTLTLAADRLAEIPASFGEWELTHREELSTSVKNMLECPGALLGTYVNRRTGESVGVALLVGPTGPMSVHTPDICYSSSRYAIVKERRETAIEGTPQQGDRFWQLELRSRSVDASYLRVYYAWSAGDRWQAPTHPRISCAMSPYLYKVQIAVNAGPPSETTADDTGRRFLREFLNAAQPHLDGKS